MDTSSLIAAVMADPNALWAILSARPRIVGPYKEAKKQNFSIHEGWWRLTPKGDDIITISPSMRLEEPFSGDFCSYLDGEEERFDEDALEETKKEHEAEKLIWKPWSIRIKGEPYGTVWYAGTFEEAKSLGDSLLKDRGYLIYEGS